MRHYILLIFIFLGVLSCKQKNKDTSIPRPDYLSTWFIQNEDSLFNEFNQEVKSELFNKSNDTNWTEYAYHNTDRTKFMGRFTLEAKKYCDSLDVTFFYNKTTIPHGRILISTDYNKRFTKALDTIFNFVSIPKYFKIQKYEPSNYDTTRNEILNLFEIGDIAYKDLRVQMIPLETLQNITVYIPTKSKQAKITDDEYEILRTQLFGEELYVKKINELKFILCNTIKPNLFTISEALNKLK